MLIRFICKYKRNIEIPPSCHGQTCLVLLFCLLTAGLLSSSQELENIWLNEYFKPVHRERAVYKKEFTMQDSVLTLKLSFLKTRHVAVEHYKNGIPVGKWQEIYKGRVKVERDFDKIEYVTYEEVDRSEILEDTLSSEPPSFPGGEEKRIQYLIKNVEYPRIARELGIQGMTGISFVLTPEGEIESVVVYKSSNPYLDYEAVRVIRAMPAWSPGKQNGKPVTVQFNMPIKFTLAR